MLCTEEPGWLQYGKRMETLGDTGFKKIEQLVTHTAPKHTWIAADSHARRMSEGTAKKVDSEHKLLLHAQICSCL